MTTAATSPGHQARAPTSPANFDPDTPGPSRPPESLDGTPLPYANREGDNEVDFLPHNLRITSTLVLALDDPYDA